MKQMHVQDQRYQRELEDRDKVKEVENKRMQEIIENLKNDQKDDSKYVKCPKWGKSEPFRAFKRRLENWDNIVKGKGKYLKLLESLQEEGRKKEKERIELEEQNSLIDPNNANVIKDIIEKMEIWFGKPQLDEACEAWKRFKIMSDDTEAHEHFVLKFETCDSNLKCSGIELQQVVLAIQFVESLNVTEDQRRSILANVKMDNTDTIYEDIKKAVRILKGSIVEGCKDMNDKDSEEVNFIKKMIMKGRTNHVLDLKANKGIQVGHSEVLKETTEDTETADQKKEADLETDIKKEAEIDTMEEVKIEKEMDAEAKK